MQPSPKNIKSPTPRLRYFDMIKGLAIFLVVMGHILTMCIRDIDRAPLFKFIGEIHMPLFFFISGWFSYKYVGGKLITPNIKRRAMQLLVPMVTVSTLWIYYFPTSGIQSPFISTWSGLWGSEWKNGYWFTLVLFEIILLYVATIPLLNVCKNFATEVLTTGGLWIGMLLIIYNLIPESIVSATSIGLSAEFYAIFMAGIIARRHHSKFNQMVMSSQCVTITLITLAITMYYVCWYWEIPNIPEWGLYPARIVLRLATVVIAINIVKPWSEKAFADNATPLSHPFARAWEYIGKQSLAIYLLHYFFLFPLGCLRSALIDMNLAFTPLFVVAFFGACAVTCITLGVNYIISKSAILALLLTGKTN